MPEDRARIARQERKLRVVPIFGCLRGVSRWVSRVARRLQVKVGGPRFYWAESEEDMFLGDVVNSSNIPALDAMLAFTQARHKVLTENIANIDTPGYQTRHLDAKQFQRALETAIARKREEHSTGLKLESSEQTQQGRSGELTFTPTKDPAENVLFHDQTNARIERQMSQLAENGMMHQATAQLLAGKYADLLRAIRGRVT